MLCEGNDMIGGSGAPGLEGGFSKRLAKGVDEDVSPALVKLPALLNDKTEREASLATRAVARRPSCFEDKGAGDDIWAAWESTMEHSDCHRVTKQPTSQAPASL